MGGFIFDQGQMNLAGLTTPGAYVQLMTPTGLAVPGPSNVAAFGGTGSWGPTNTAIGPFGDVDHAAAAVGQFKVANWQSDPFDLMRGVMQALGEAVNDAALALYLLRISDGTDVAASITIHDTTAVTPLVGATANAKYTGTGGNTIKIVISQGNGPTYFNVLIAASISGKTVTELFQNIAGNDGTGASPFWTNLNLALTKGNSSRGPSNLLGALTLGSNQALNPALGTYTLTGGTDGRAGVTAATFFGSDTLGDRTGVYAFRGLPNVPAYFHCCGLYDATKWPLIQQLCTTEVMRYIAPLAAGTSTLDAVTARNTNGIADKRFMYGKDWIYWTDPVSGQTIFTDPVAVMIGRAASLSPELSPLNKQVYTVVATEHQGVYPSDEIGLLETNGIWVIANPCLGNNYMGIATSQTTSLNPIEQPVEYARLEDYIGVQFAATLAQFVGDKQGPYDPDPTRGAIKSDIDSMMRACYKAGLIADWESECDAADNPPSQVQAGYVQASTEYVAFSTIKFVIEDLSVTNSLTAGQAFAQHQLNQQGG